MPFIKLNYTVSGEDFTRAGEASGNVKRTLKKLGFDPGVIRRVSVAMYEGEINMAIHGGGGTAKVEIAPEAVKIALEDEGPGIPDLEMAMREGYSTACEKIRRLGFGAGMGLPNMKKHSDEMKVETSQGNGTKIHMTINNL